MIDMQYNDSPTDYIRKVLAETKGEFSADLFREISNSSTILFKFARRGEIAFVRWEPNDSHHGGRPYKMYRVVKLKVFKHGCAHNANPKPKPIPKPMKRNVVPLHPVVQNWKDAFPDMFAVPDFKILGKTSHKLEMNYGE